MRNEEALKKVRGYLTDYLPLEDADEIDEIIEALEPSVTPSYNSIKTELKPCEDCISREAVIDVVRKWFDKIQLNGDICLDGIISLPSITPRNNLAESSQDCISRQEAISAIQDKYYDNATGIDIVDIVAHLPSVTPKAESEEII